MKSSEKNMLSADALYTFLAFYMALSALIIYIFMLDMLISINSYAVIYILFGTLSALMASFYSGLLKNSKTEKISGNIRGAILITAAVYLISSIFLTDLILPERFIPNQVNIISSICALYTWINVISYRKLFNARLQFNTITENYNGEKLTEKLIEDSSLLSYTKDYINKAQFNYFFQLVIAGILVLISAVLKIQLPLTLRLLLLFIFAAGVCIHALFQIIKREQYYAGEGINLSAGSKNKRLLAVIALTFPAIVISIFPASDKSLIPFSLITGFFAWFFSLYKAPPADTTTLNEKINYPDFAMNTVDASVLESIPSSPFWETFAKYSQLILKYGLIILAAGLFIRFMIAPLLNRGKDEEKNPFFSKLKKLIINWYKGMLNAISSFFIQLKKEETMKLNADEIRRAAELIFNAYSPAKRKDIKQNVTLFASLIVWGDKVRNVSWKPSFAPGEYCGILSSSAVESETDSQQLNENIIRCGEIFEKSLYSADVLSDSEKSEFKKLVEEITSAE